MGKKLFDYVIGNPPYQEDTKGAGRQAKPIYNLFVDNSKNIAKRAFHLLLHLGGSQAGWVLKILEKKC